MTAPRAREQCRPPSPPDRRPPRRGGPSSSQTASAAGRPAGLARLAGARRGLFRSAGALAAAALLALSGAVALPATAEAQTTCTLNPVDIWCGVVTVGEFLLGGNPYADGFSAAVEGEYPQVGDLSETNFTYGTNSYTIDAILVEKPNASSVREGVLVSLTSALTTSPDYA